MSESRIALADLVDALRAEVETARLRAEGNALQFEVQDIQLEVEVTTTGTRETEGGIRVWVVTIGGKVSKGDTATHKVTLNLSAVTSAGTKVKVRDVSRGPVRRT